jgi:predicted TIM-barrel fold metal-dependent hydrolase
VVGQDLDRDGHRRVDAAPHGAVPVRLLVAVDRAADADRSIQNRTTIKEIASRIPVGFLAAEVPVELTVAAMDEAGVDRALICAWYGPDGPLISNDEVATTVAGSPGPVGGVASVDLRGPVPAVRELRRAVQELGLRALRIVPGCGGAPNHRLYDPLLAERVHLGVPFPTQVGHTGPLRTSETGRPIP